MLAQEIREKTDNNRVKKRNNRVLAKFYRVKTKYNRVKTKSNRVKTKSNRAKLKSNRAETDLFCAIIFWEYVIRFRDDGITPRKHRFKRRYGPLPLSGRMPP